MAYSLQNTFMKLIRILAQSTLVGASLLGLGILSTQAQSNLPPGAEDMPTGYVLSKTPIAGKHCYHHGGGARLFLLLLSQNQWI
ncbi:MAG: hypothetical protein HC790_05050 [Acaryochloridaceae cyanobacterium CSU_3_4]|nr:hypothetical protein [Acaryochloridaceae cyanobacterium CSU_3_4]